MCQHWERVKPSSWSEDIAVHLQQAYIALLQAGRSFTKHDVICLTCHLHADCPQALSCGHGIYVSLQRMELYCTECEDVIYDNTFDQVIQEVMTTAGLQENGKLNADKALNRCLDSIQTPIESELQTNTQGNAGQLPELQIMKQSRQAGNVDGLPAGLRGLVNLGNTCFLSSVLHAMLHAPPLRDFYLSGGHPPSSCSRSDGASCLSCELDKVFSAMYSGSRSPYSPTDFLAAWWHHSDCLAGYQQQDAHEFYLFALSGLEGSRVITRTTPTPSNPSNLPSGMQMEKSSSEMDLPASNFPSGSQTEEDSAWEDCKSLSTVETRPSMTPRDRQASPAPRIDGRMHSTSSGTEGTKEEGIVERAFEGILRSDMCCCRCGYTSTTHEPFLALSMDIDPPKQPPQPLLRPEPGGPRAASPLNKNGKRLVGAALAASNKAAAKKARLEAKAAKLAAQAAVLPGEEATPPAVESKAASDFAARLSQNNALDHMQVVAAPTVINGFVMEPTRAAPSMSNLATQETGPVKVQREMKASKPTAKSQKGGPKRPRTVRCGECHTCLNKHLKKACMRNAELKKRAESLAQSQSLETFMTPGQGSMPTTVWVPNGHHESLPSQVPQTCHGQVQQTGNPKSQPSFYPQGMLQHAQTVKPDLDPFQPQDVFREDKLMINDWEMEAGGMGQHGLADQPYQGADADDLSLLVPNSHHCNDNLSSGLLQDFRALGHPHANQASGEGLTIPNPRSLAVDTAGSLTYPGNSSQLDPSIPRLEPSHHRGLESRLGGGLKGGARECVAPETACQQHSTASRRNPTDVGLPTLTGCLRRYTRSEHVAKWTCEACAAKGGRKQLSIRTLPRIMCFHIKRFRHAGAQRQGQKIESPILYPSQLDLEPFLTTSILQQRFQQPGTAKSRLFPKASDGEEGQAQYELYTIICHKGNIKGGHYIAYLKCDNQWYECDDSWVTAVDEDTAFNAQAYMLFYRLLQ